MAPPAINPSLTPLVWLLSHADLQANGRPVECLWCAPGPEGTVFHIRHIGELRVTEDMLSILVANFQAHDRTPPRVPLNVNHQGDSGNIQEARAIGWILDLAVARGPQRVSLLFHPHWSDDAREVIEAGGFRFVSVGVELAAVNPINGEQMGPRLREVSVTNCPAIPDLAPIELRRVVALDAAAKAELANGVGPNGEPDMLDKARAIARAFYGLHPDSDGQEWCIEAVFYDARLMVVTEIVRQVDGAGAATQERMWQLGFQVPAEGGVTFAPREQWQRVEKRFVPAPAQAAQEGQVELGAVARQPNCPKHSGDPAWDARAAVGRVRTWATADGALQPAKYRQAFAWFDGAAPDNVGSYKLPHHDVEDGKLVVVRKGMMAAGNAMSGARGGVQIPEGDMAGVRGHLATHYAQFEMTPPWQAEAGGVTTPAAVLNDEESSAAAAGRDASASEEKAPMDEIVAQIRAALGLPEEADAEAVLAAVKALKEADTASAEAARVAAQAAEQQTRDELTAKDRRIVALTDQARQAGDQVTQLTARVDSLEREKNQREAEAAIREAMESGKLTAAEVSDEKSPMRRLALSDRDTFRQIIQLRPAVQLGTEITKAGDPEQTGVNSEGFWALVHAARSERPELSHQEAQEQALAAHPEYRELFQAANKAAAAWRVRSRG